MLASHEMPTSNEIARLVREFQGQGVELWCEDGRLRYRAPRGSLARDDVDRLRHHRSGIVALLENMPWPETASVKLARLPLASSQLAHWQLNELATELSYRGLAVALRLRGRLNVDVLEKSITALVARHGALRTRIVSEEGRLWQLVGHPPQYWALEVNDLSKLPASEREQAILRSIEGQVLERTDPTKQLPFATRLLELDSDEHVLILSVDHLVSDAASLNVLTQDLFDIYSTRAGIQSGAEAHDPRPRPSQFSTYIKDQAAQQSAWVQQHGQFWKEHFSGLELTRLPTDAAASPNVGITGWTHVPVHLNESLTSAIRDFCRSAHTTMAMCAFTAYVALVLERCGARENAFQFVTDGRTDPSSIDAIGYFASPLLLRISREDGDSFSDLLRRTTREYCNVYEHEDASFIASQRPRNPLTLSSVFNWVPSPLEPSSARDLADLTVEPISFTNASIALCQWDSDPHLVLSDFGATLSGGIYFPASRFSSEQMQLLLDEYVEILGRMLSKPAGSATE